MNVISKSSTQLYTKNFYLQKQGWTHDSADIVISELFKIISPKSVIDVGCGIGTWLAACVNNGIDDVLGVDGDYVEKAMLEIPEHQFLSHDLATDLKIERTFDLAISLEVAEHLHENRAKSFVDTLTQAAPIVLFSAAIPYQGGVHHVNEQWQDYWYNLFIQKDYLPSDILRKRIWRNNKVAEHYIQNIILYIKKDYAESHPILSKSISETDINLLNVVHPRRYIKLINKINNLERSYASCQRQKKNMKDPQYMSLSRHLSVLPKLLVNAISNRFKKIF